MQIKCIKFYQVVDFDATPLVYNPTSSRVVASFWVKLVCSWMGHLVGIAALTTTIFWVIPPTQ